MEICFINSKGNGAVLPHVPPGLGVENGAATEEKDTLDGKITIRKTRNLKAFSIEALFPTHDYSWIKPSANMAGYDYLDYFQEANDNLDILKCYVISGTGETVLFMKCVIESFSYNIDRAGDISYSMSVKEYVKVEPKKVTKL